VIAEAAGHTRNGELTDQPRAVAQPHRHVRDPTSSAANSAGMKRLLVLTSMV
jgi:hypothetical protein